MRIRRTTTKKTEKVDKEKVDNVGPAPGGLEGLGGELLQLVRHQVHGQGELVNAGLRNKY